MIELLSDKIISKITHADELYYRLILLVGEAGTGKTAALRDVHQRIGAPLVNVNLEMSLQMLDLSEIQRALQLSRLLSKMVNSVQGEVVLLDNIELLFAVPLKQDPLRLLQGLSRNKIVVAAWNGFLDKDNLTYATPDHPEYRRYKSKDILIVNTEVTA